MVIAVPDHMAPDTTHECKEGLTPRHICRAIDPQDHSPILLALLENCDLPRALQQKVKAFVEH